MALSFHSEQNFDADEARKLAQVGLCSRCLHMREIHSDRGSIFYMCQLSATDSRFPKYPRLPVCSAWDISHATQIEPNKFQGQPPSAVQSQRS